MPAAAEAAVMPLDPRRVHPRRVGRAKRAPPRSARRSLVAILLLWACFAAAVAARARADDWPQWRGPTRDGVWRESGIVEKFAGPELKPRWRAAVAGGYSGPTVAAGRVYLTDRLTKPSQVERVLCFDAANGKPLWTHAYPCPYGSMSFPCGPRASVTIHDGRAYALGTMGHLHCLDAATGAVLWKKDVEKEYGIRIPIWGIAAAPLIEGELVILNVGAAQDKTILALDRKTGRERWAALDDPASYSAPIVVERGGRRVLVCWTGSRLVGLEPSTGKVLWAHPFVHRRWIGMVATPVVAGGKIFVSTMDEGSLLVEMAADGTSSRELWRRRGANEIVTDALHTMISTPRFDGNYVYGVDSYGQLRCLDVKTGDRLWEDTTAVPKARWSNIHIVQNGENSWLFNERGELIIARLSPAGYRELSRAKLLKPTLGQLPQRGGVCWSHPAFAQRCVFARNDEELVAVSLAAE